MNLELMKRIERLRVDLRNCDPEDREALLDQLEQAVALLETKGDKAPVWAHSRLSDRIDESVEDMFDNMPV